MGEPARLRLRPADVIKGATPTMRPEDQERSDQQANASPGARSFAAGMAHFHRVESALAVETERADALERGHNILSAENSALRSQLTSEREQYRGIVARLTGERDVLARHVTELTTRMRTAREGLESFVKGFTGAIREAEIVAYKPKPRVPPGQEGEGDASAPADEDRAQAMLRQLETTITATAGSGQQADG